MQVKDAIYETLEAVFSDHLSRTKGTLYPWLDAAHDLVVNEHRLQKVYDMLSDDESRLTFVWFLKFRLAGYLTQSRKIAHEVIPQIVDEASWTAMLRTAENIPERDLEGHLPIDVVENFILDGYNLKGICGVENGDVVFDLGSFNGNSSIVFARAAGPAGHVFAFEPNPDTQQMLSRNLAKAKIYNVEVVPAGASDSKGTLRFSSGGAASKFTNDGEIEAPIYHLHFDPHEIPLLVKKLCPWYKFYIRHNNVGEGEIVLFCSPISRVPGR